MYFTHSLVGALVSKPIIEKENNSLTHKECHILWFVGVTASVLPDFDLIYSALHHFEGHRNYITHGVFIYLALSFLIYLIGQTTKRKEFFKLLSTIFFIGVLSHIFMDFLMGKVAFLAPFSLKTYGFSIVKGLVTKNFAINYLTSIYIVTEISIYSLFSLVFASKIYNFVKYYSLMYVFMASVSFFVLTLFFR